MAFGAIIGQRSPTATADVHPQDPIVTARVEYRQLIDTLVTRGTVEQPNLIEVTARSPGPDDLYTTLTRAPKQVGDLLEPGTVLLEVNNRPLIIIPGVVPLFRNIRPGDTGADVEGLQRSLTSLGYMPEGIEPGIFGPATREALVALYHTAGYEPTYTQGDRTSTERVIASTEASVREAQQELEHIRSAVAIGEASQNELQDAFARLDSAVSERDFTRYTEGVVAPAEELLPVAVLPASVVSIYANEGQQIEPGTTILAIAAGTPHVAVSLTSAQTSLIPDMTNAEVRSNDGLYTETCSIPEPSFNPKDAPPEHPDETAPDDPDPDTLDTDRGPPTSGSSPQNLGPDMVLSLSCETAPPSGYRGQDIRVQFSRQVTDASTFVVPSTALVVDNAGNSYIDLVDHDKVERLRINVVGDAAGFVAIEAPSKKLAEGDEVRVRRE